jgi:hypothetical protein
MFKLASSIFCQRAILHLHLIIRLHLIIAAFVAAAVLGWVAECLNVVQS